MSLRRGRGAVMMVLAGALLAAQARAGVTVTPIGGSPDDAGGAGLEPAGEGTGTGVPTAAEAQGLADAGQYKDALKVLLRLLDMRGAAVTFDRQQMLILRGECQLQIHQNAAALTSLEQARTEATVAGLDDDAAQAAALSYLIQKSRGYAYTPRTGTNRKPINILDKGSRQAAYAALFTDAFGSLQEKLRAATVNSALPVMVDVAKESVYVRAVEKMSSVGTAQTDTLMKDASHAALRLVSSTLTAMQTKVNRISLAANQMVNQSSSNGQWHHMGLTSDEVQALKDIGATCETFPAVLADFSKAFGNGQIFQNESRMVDSIKDRAEAVLTKDYRIP